MSTNTNRGCCIIYVAGNNGAGKTTVTKLLAKSLAGHMLLSNAADSTYCRDIHRNPARFAFEAQLSFLVSKTSEIQTALRRNPRFLVVDRSPYEDAEIFARYWFSSGYIDPRAYRTYRQVAQAAVLSVGQPGLVIYLHASLDTLKKRILTRLRPHERSYTSDFVTRLQQLYARWSRNFRLCPVIRVDMDLIDYLGENGPDHLSKLRRDVLGKVK